MNRTSTDPERKRQAEGRDWEAWGPYLSERQWGTVREDYSPHGTEWEYFPHDHARSRAYRWGEDGLGGFSDHRARMCVAIALWNERDPILKERLFGLTNSEANHGEDVKELYYYLDATPTRSYLRMLYKYPQAAFPYTDLVAENRRRNKQQPEYELVDTGVFDDDRYFDVEIEYAKADAEDFLLQVTVHNRGPETASAQLAKLERKISATVAERRRLADLYQTDFIERDELLRRGKELQDRKQTLEEQRATLIAERKSLAHHNQLRARVMGFTNEIAATIDRLDFDQRQKLLRLVVEHVRVQGWQVHIKLRIPLDEPPAPTRRRLSRKDRLRSLHGHPGEWYRAPESRRPGSTGQTARGSTSPWRSSRTVKSQIQDKT
jgi:hypothetical protein